MNQIKEYINGFINRSGSYVLFSTMAARVLSLLGSWIALQLIEAKELGVILFAYGIVQFIIPIGGFGLHQSLIRYGALLKSEDEKQQLFSYVLKKGIVASIAIILVLVGIGYFIPFQFDKTYVYFSILSLSILTVFILEIIKIQFRLQHKNRLYAITEFWYNIILTGLIFGLSYLFQGMGYIIALIVSPVLTALFFIKKLNVKLHLKNNLKITNISFWKYGFFGGLSSVVTQLLILIDIILIGYLIDDPVAVTNYRYISIIPFSLLFLPRVFITTDFVTFTEKIHQKDYINRYIKNYMLFFGVVSILLLLFSYFFAEQILYIFGVEYMDYADSFLILIMGIIGIYIFRGLFGNLLSSIGKIELNYYIISIAIVINVISNYYLIPLYGIKGAAITSAILMWFTGILSWLSFLYFFRKNRYE
ncbi:polysaccharide biosynthesis C-terminal domain-containing protein [Flavobacteriaceae bacterium]|nr:polysaccharide biosynthesis C-terminal domain-containing protein [Flavobacteriaceae bacterium]MDB2685064.1 polysaccharide biosynthesis C-terminal domain-containing protein [Flavobacteriaceae bacterium]MDB4256816.1 polysaccharide biosynthesis C-terminal domain-containing protein [Flavobacteriaceae bacterium]MDC0636565.1 polysaccharide biosynthesis C-terminal domain-containing protein [Flavobacteriaceae bacterium]